MPNGLGSTIKSITTALGIKPCSSCNKRADKLDEWFPYKSKIMIKPNKEIPLPTGPELIEYKYAGQVSFNKAGVQKQLVLQLLRYRANSDGTNPVETAPATQVYLYGQGLNKDEKVIAAVAKYNEANEAAIQQLIIDLGD